MSARELQLSDAVLLHEVGEVEAAGGDLGSSSRCASRHAEPMPLIPGNQDEVQVASFDWFNFDSINEYAASRHSVPLIRPSKGKGNNALTSVSVNSDVSRICVVSRSIDGGTVFPRARGE